MGETAADTRQEIEETRDELDATLTELRSRSARVKTWMLQAAVAAGGVAIVGGAAVAAVFIARRRRGGPVTRSAKRLPKVARPAAVPAARSADRWLSRRSKRLEQQREELVDALSARIAEHQAEAERRANPLWRRTAAKALEAAVGVGAAAAARQLVERGRDRTQQRSDDAAHGDARQLDVARSA